MNQTVALLAARAPKPRTAVRDAKKAGHACVVADGTPIPIDRVAADQPFYSGKHRKHGMNLQVIASPGGDVLRASGALPGSVHDKKAERIWGVLGELEAAGLVTLAGKGHQASTRAKIRYRGKNKPQSHNDANKAHAQLRSPGERANAQLKTWHILRKLRCCPCRAGQPAKANHVLQAREANAGGKWLGEPDAARLPGEQHVAAPPLVIHTSFPAAEYIGSVGKRGRDPQAGAKSLLQAGKPARPAGRSGTAAPNTA